jgi:thiol:disulfide interchange protein
MNPRKTLSLLFLLGVLTVGYVSMGAAPVKSDGQYSYHGETAWRTNVTAAMQDAAAQDKPVLLYFWTTWCTYCEDYNREVYSSPVVQNRLDEFVLVAVNMDRDTEAVTRLQRQYNVNYPPQHVAVTANGTQLSKLPGYAPEDDFVAYLDRSQARYNAS